MDGIMMTERKNSLEIPLSPENGDESACVIVEKEDPKKNRWRPCDGHKKNPGEWDGCCYIVLGSCCIFGGAIFLGFLFGVVVPHFAVKDFLNGTCVVESSEILDKRISCSCGQKCSSSYQCLIIKVRLTDENGIQEQDITNLYSSPYNLDSQCTTNLKRCERSKSLNDWDVTKYKSSWGSVGQQYRCMYDPDDHSRVFRDIFYDDMAMMHFLLWPGLFTFLSILGVIILYFAYGCHYCCDFVKKNNKCYRPGDREFNRQSWPCIS